MDKLDTLVKRFLEDNYYIKYVDKQLDTVVIYTYNDKIKIWNRINIDSINSLFLTYISEKMINPFDLLTMNVSSILKFGVYIKSKIPLVQNFQFNKKSYNFPTNNGLIINSQTNTISVRNYTDHFTYFYQAKYLNINNLNHIKSNLLLYFDNMYSELIDIIGNIFFFGQYKNKSNFIFYSSYYGNPIKDFIFNLINHSFGKYIDNFTDDIDAPHVCYIIEPNINDLKNIIRKGVFIDLIFTHKIINDKFIDEHYNFVDLSNLKYTPDSKYNFNEYFTFIVNEFLKYPNINLDSNCRIM